METIKRFGVAGVVIGLILLGSAPSARSQATRIAKGDLAEFVSGLGPMLGEVIGGPDASNYYLLLVPGQGEVPINGNKLRLVQPAGTPNAPFKPGDVVSWTDQHIREHGTIEKVTGAWCQVKSTSATTIGWIECKDLRTPKQAAKPPAGAAQEGAERSAAATDALVAGAASPKLSGDWENADGTIKLEFQSGGKCYISLGPMSDKCTYKQSADKTIVRFADEDLVLTANDDGSLSSPPDGFMPIRLKKKKP